jgi:lysophospholipase L1-like esterase
MIEPTLLPLDTVGREDPPMATAEARALAPCLVSGVLKWLHTEMRNWERCVLLVVLWPILWLQSKHVRRVTPRMPEPTGSREGICGQGSVCRVLVVGDSGAAGVGVTTQNETLCGQLALRLSRHHRVEWCVLALNGLDSPGLVKLLEDAPMSHFDVVVLSMGANDVTCLCTPRRWVLWQTQLAELIARRFAPNLLVHSAVPPIHACMALPQPLRWFMGRWALEMNALLSSLLSGQEKRIMHWHPEATTLTGMAADGIHPSSHGYAQWADGLSQLILAADISRKVCQHERPLDLPRVRTSTERMRGRPKPSFRDSRITIGDYPRSSSGTFAVSLADRSS